MRRNDSSAESLRRGGRTASATAFAFFLDTTFLPR
jgi:hypothetical protein